MSDSQDNRRSSVYLIGAGVVGRAILRAHVDAGVSVYLADQDETAVADAVAELELNPERWSVSAAGRIGNLHARELTYLRSPAISRMLVIESITERLDAKRAFFSEAERLFDSDALLCSNTSTLRIAAIAEPLSRPERLCGMHFFMPVQERQAVEIIAGEKTSPETASMCAQHARRIDKEPLVAGDGPGFIVNRLLSPYLNESLLLLGRGIGADAIERAATAFGMPMSPLELIDLIGIRTVFDAGRVYWQAFPNRVDPAPILPGLLKRKLTGRSGGRGLYHYDAGGARSAELSPQALELCDAYRRDVISLQDDEIVQLLSIPMWIEGAMALHDGVVESSRQLNLAMRGGLGYDDSRDWTDFFEQLGGPAIAAAIDRWSPISASIRAPQSLVQLLGRTSPTEALEHFSAGAV